MPIEGHDEYENLSHRGGPREGAPVRYGDFVVPSAVAWVRRPAGRHPAVRAEFEMRPDGPVCLSVSITTTPKGRPVITGDLETLPGLDKKAHDAFKALAIRRFDDEDWDAGRNLGRIGEIYAPDRRTVGPALRKRSDEELSQVAEVYRANIDGRPVEAVEAAFGYPRRTADRRIRAARDRGFLPETTRGKRKA